MAHVDGRAVRLEQRLDDVDRADDTRAEAPGSGDEDALAHAEPAPRARAAARSSAGSARRAFRRGTQSAPRLAQERGRPRRPRRCRRQGRSPARAGRRASSGVSEIARTTPTSRPLAASGPLSMSTATAPVRAARLAPLGRRVHDPLSRRTRPRPRASGTGSGSPSQSSPPSLVDDLRGGDERPGAVAGRPARRPARSSPGARQGAAARRRARHVPRMRLPARAALSSTASAQASVNEASTRGSAPSP